MTPPEIHAQVLALASKELRLTGALQPGDLSESLDSVQRLTLVIAIEDHFEISFGADEEHEVRSLDDVVAAIARKLSTAHAGAVDAP